MGVKYLWDTNTAIYYLQQQFSLPAEKFMDEVTKESPPCISVITEIELLCWKTATPQDLAILHGFIQNAVVNSKGQLNSRRQISVEIIKLNFQMLS
jgi:hypothetical protein